MEKKSVVPKSRLPKVLLWVFMGAVLIIFVIHGQYLKGGIDDAFISFRYARNLASGYGFVFNPGGKRVEGFTNLLWVLILSLLYNTGIGFITASRVLGLLLGAGSLLGVFAIARKRIGSYSLWAVLPPLVLACNSCFVGWSVRMMGTPLFTFLVVAGIYFHCQRRWLPSGIILGIAALSRQEVILIALPLWVTLLLVGFPNEQKKETAKNISTAAIPLGIMLMGLLIWRLLYFGYPLPNTFYAKVSGGWIEYSHGFRYVKEFFYKYLAYWLIPGLLFLGWKKIQVDHYLKALGGIVLLYFIYIIYIGGDYPFHPFYRYFHPLLPFAILLSCELLFRASQTLEKRGRKALYIIIVLALALTILPSREQKYDRNLTRVIRGGRFLGTWLRQNTPPDTTLAVGPAGAIPFYANRFTYDLHGLTDTHIAHRKITMSEKNYSSLGKYDAEYIIQQAPDIIMLNPSTSRSPREYDLNHPGLAAMAHVYRDVFNHPEFRKNYTLKLIPIHDFFLHLYFHKRHETDNSFFINN
jgi:hypothetical protein